MKNDTGFTIAEILVVIAIVAIFGMILVMIFTNTLRGSNKAQILAVIKQNGQAVLDKMDRTIRSASEILCVTPDKKSLVLKDENGYIRYRFIPPNNTNLAIGSCGGTTDNANGCFQQENPVRPEDGENAEQDPKIFEAHLCENGDSLRQGVVILTDTNTLSGVSVSDALAVGAPARDIFTPGSEMVTIRFYLHPAVGVSSATAAQIDPVDFQTTIGVR